MHDSGKMLELFTAKKKGYILEVDVEYPHNDLPFMLENMKIDKIERNRKKCVVFIRVLYPSLKHGLVLKKVHRILSFSQSDLLKEDDNILFKKLSDKFKTQEMCNAAVQKNNDMIKYVPDWFVTAEMLEKCKDGEWVEKYKDRKDEKAMIKEELLPVAWHPDRVFDLSFDEDEKEVPEMLWKV